MKYDVQEDPRAPGRLYWVRELSETGRAKRLTGWQTKERAEKDRAAWEADQFKRERAKGRALGSPQR